MGADARTTYLDRLKSRWKDRPWVAWTLLAASVVIGVGAVLGVLRPYVGSLLAWGDGPALNITLDAFDPRFSAAGERMNWGGGSQALFFELAEGAPERVTTEEILDLPELEARGRLGRVWEAFFGPVSIIVDAVYDASRDAPTCVIREWGVELEATELPQAGIPVCYRTGGAYVPRTGGTVVVPAAEGRWPVTTWIDAVEGEEEVVPPPPTAFALKPGEPALLTIDIECSAESDGRFTAERIQQPELRAAYVLHVYARVLIAGEEHLVRSRNALRVVLLEGWNQEDWELGTLESLWLEDFRPRTIF